MKKSIFWLSLLVLVMVGCSQPKPNGNNGGGDGKTFNPNDPLGGAKAGRSLNSSSADWASLKLTDDLRAMGYTQIYSMTDSYLAELTFAVTMMDKLGYDVMDNINDKISDSQLEPLKSYYNTFAPATPSLEDPWIFPFTYMVDANRISPKIGTTTNAYLIATSFVVNENPPKPTVAAVKKLIQQGDYNIITKKIPVTLVS